MNQEVKLVVPLDGDATSLAPLSSTVTSSSLPSFIRIPGDNVCISATLSTISSRDSSTSTLGIPCTRRPDWSMTTIVRGSPGQQLLHPNLDKICSTISSKSCDIGEAGASKRAGEAGCGRTGVSGSVMSSSSCASTCCRAAFSPLDPPESLARPDCDRRDDVISCRLRRARSRFLRRRVSSAEVKSCVSTFRGRYRRLGLGGFFSLTILSCFGSSAKFLARRDCLLSCAAFFRFRLPKASSSSSSSTPIWSWSAVRSNTRRIISF